MMKWYERAGPVTGLCLGCGQEVVDYYKLPDRTWRRLVAKPDRDKELCWACLTLRLGREPRLRDFRATPIQMMCLLRLSSREGLDAWNAVFSGRMKHLLFRALVKGTASVEEFEANLIAYARSKGLLA